MRFQRVLPGPVERVWDYLTDPEKRALWLAGGPMELREGGRVELRFRHADLSPRKEPTPERFRDFVEGAVVEGRVTRCEPPRLLAYTWGEDTGHSEVTFELTPRDGEVLLVVTHRRLPGELLVSVAGGWHTHLVILADRLNDREPRPFWSAFLQIEQAYESRVPGEAGQPTRS